MSAAIDEDKLAELVVRKLLARGANWVKDLLVEAAQSDKIAARRSDEPRIMAMRGPSLQPRKEPASCPDLEPASESSDPTSITASGESSISTREEWAQTVVNRRLRTLRPKRTR